MTALEINLLAKNGISDDAILSVRAGTVRRQALINSGRPFRFPKSSLDGNPIKIDVMQTVGSAYLVLNPTSEQYKVSFDKDSQISAELSVRRLADGAGAEVKEEPAAKEMAVSAKDAKDYLESHQILQFVQAVLQTVIKERPAEPYGYMAKHFHSGYDQGEAKASAPSSPPPPAPVPEAPPAPPTAMVPAELPPAKEEAKAVEEKPAEAAPIAEAAPAKEEAKAEEPKAEEKPAEAARAAE